MKEQALFEHRFWLQILGDHARFIYNALSPVEPNDIGIALSFINQYDQLLTQARMKEEDINLAQLNKHAYELTANFRAYKLNLLDRLLFGQIKIGLTPTFFNHMVNELEEYIRILVVLLEGKPVPQYAPLHHDLVWLLDAAGHGAAIATNLDAVEKRLIKKSKQFQQNFNELYLKAVELAGYLRTLRIHYPSIAKFHSDVNLEMSVFMAFLKEIEELGLSAELLSRINPLVPDHMFREECYYLLKLSQSGAVPPPNCDPTKPRVM